LIIGVLLEYITHFDNLCFAGISNHSSKTPIIKVGYIFQQNTEYQSGLDIPAKHRLSKWVRYSSKTQIIKVG
jgi:hypothetical protein